MNYCVLGTRAGAGPYNSQHPSALAVLVGSELLLFDCGEGSVLQLQRAGIKRSALSAVFITHRHPDHCIGLLGLIAALSSDRRTKSLKIIAPTEVQDWLQQSIETLQLQLHFEIDLRQCEPGCLNEVYRSEEVQVDCAPTVHRVPSFGYRATAVQAPRINFDALLEVGAASPDQISRLRRDRSLRLEDGRTVRLEDFMTEPRETVLAYSGDTKLCDSLLDLVRHADVFVCEATFTQKFAARAAETCHMTALDAASLSLKAGVQRLVLTHFSTRYRDTAEHLAEASAVFPSVEAASELAIKTV